MAFFCFNKSDDRLKDDRRKMLTLVRKSVKFYELSVKIAVAREN